MKPKKKLTKRIIGVSSQLKTHGRLIEKAITDYEKTLKPPVNYTKKQHRFLKEIKDAIWTSPTSDVNNYGARIHRIDSIHNNYTSIASVCTDTSSSDINGHAVLNLVLQAPDLARFIIEISEMYTDKAIRITKSGKRVVDPRKLDGREQMLLHTANNLIKKLTS